MAPKVTGASARTRKSFTNAQKSRMIQLMEKPEPNEKPKYRALAENLNFPRQNLSRWWNQKTQILAADGKRRRLGEVKRPIKYPDVEKVVIEYIHYMRSLKLLVTTRTVLYLIGETFPGRFENKETCIRWIYRMLHRNMLAFRRKTNDQHVLDEEEMGEIHLDFVAYLQ